MTCEIAPQEARLLRGVSVTDESLESPHERAFWDELGGRLMISRERLLEVLDFEPFTGFFRWKGRLGPRAAAGTIAGSDDGQGYVRIRVDGKGYRAHRLAWLAFYGKWPNGQIDHINHCRSDNRIENLREVTHSENQRNASRSKRNISGHPGVSFESRRRKWRVEVSITGANGRSRRKHIGYFENLNDAADASRKALLENRYHPNHGS